MSGFSADWLDLREPADRKARNGEIAQALEARFAQRDRLRVADLGCGTGANLRAVAPLLPRQQDWVLIDHDVALLEAARDRLCDWAEHGDDKEGGVTLKADGREISVRFKQADLSTGLQDVIDAAPDLITASALFDLTSRDFINDVVKIAASCKSVLYGVLTYDGRQAWQPRHPSDNAIIAAFNKHQTGDKGFGPAAGPTGADILGDSLRACGYVVHEGPSPWRLESGALLRELVAGTVSALSSSGDVDNATLARWKQTARQRVEISHTDVLGVPG